MEVFPWLRSTGLIARAKRISCHSRREIGCRRDIWPCSWRKPATLLDHNDAIVDYKLFWIACKDTPEAHYLLAIINSDALFEKVTPLMSNGQFGARDLQKHLWKLSIPEFDPEIPLHVAVSDVGEAAEDTVRRLLSR